MEWLECRLVKGHGVASGLGAANPYPAGTIELQRPYFAALGLDLSACFKGTLNLSVAPLEWRLQHPDHCFEHLAWTPLHPPETFSFWRIQVRRLGSGTDCLAPDDSSTELVPALIYLPDPSTKVRHFQPPMVLEVLAPPLGPVAVGDRFALGVDPTKVGCLDGVRLRAHCWSSSSFGSLLPRLNFSRIGAQVLVRPLSPGCSAPGWGDACPRPWPWPMPICWPPVQRPGISTAPRVERFDC